MSSLWVPEDDDIEGGWYFTIEEMKCTHTGICYMSNDFMIALNDLRNLYGKPIEISSGFRDGAHPIEAAKGQGKSGVHAQGTAADIRCSGHEAHKLLQLIMSLNVFTGIGISQKGPHKSRYIHVDMGEGLQFMRPWIWSY